MNMYGIASKMSGSLLREARRRNVSLFGLTVKNFNGFLDDAFGDGGEVRCEKFGDLALPYSTTFGEIGSAAEEKARWECIELALSIISGAAQPIVAEAGIRVEKARGSKE